MPRRTIILAVLLAVAMGLLSITLAYGQPSEGEIIIAAANPVDTQTGWAINSALPDDSRARTLGNEAEEPAAYSSWSVRCIVVIGGDGGEALLAEWREVFPDAPYALVVGKHRIDTAMKAGVQVRKTCGLGQ